MLLASLIEGVHTRISSSESFAQLRPETTELLSRYVELNGQTTQNSVEHFSRLQLFVIVVVVVVTIEG